MMSDMRQQFELWTDDLHTNSPGTPIVAVVSKADLLDQYSAAELNVLRNNVRRYSNSLMQWFESSAITYNDR